MSETAFAVKLTNACGRSFDRTFGNGFRAARQRNRNRLHASNVARQISDVGSLSTCTVVLHYVTIDVYWHDGRQADTEKIVVTNRQQWDLEFNGIDHR